VTLDVVSNFKKIFFEVLKNPELSNELGPIVMCLSPAVLLQMNAKFDVQFEDLAEIKDLPMMEPFLANFSQLFEGMAGSDVETMINDRIVMEEGQEVPAPLKQSVEACHTLFDVLQAMDGELEINASIPNLASLKTKVKSEDLGKALLIGVKATAYDKKIKPKYEWAT
jgi:hypothetical protein